jgi:hypothetical protein
MVSGIPPAQLFEDAVHAHAHGGGSGVENRTDLLKRQTGAVAQGKQMLLLGP